MRIMTPFPTTHVSFYRPGPGRPGFLLLGWAKMKLVEIEKTLILTAF